MITIYHNPRCRKSREGVELLEQSGKDFAIVKYLDEPISEDQLIMLLNYWIYSSASITFRIK
ncbi:MAG: hypothetical protein WA775_10820 [Psychroserpens sp.]|uniref:hypothetical protein n=1 Tax=Psychroserpens sp. TaxID=2020870 RepID=UPI003C717927